MSWISSGHSEAAYFDQRSRVCTDGYRFHGYLSGSPRIIGSDITGATINGSPVIRKSTIAGDVNHTFIQGNPRVVGSGIWKAAAVSDNARVVNSNIGGALVGSRVAWVGGNADARNPTVSNAGAVSGSAIARNSTITGDGKVDCGRWVNITVTTDRRAG